MTKKNRKSLADAIREEIAAEMQNGRTVQDICLDAGIAPPVITRWLSGARADIKLSTAEKLAAYYGLQLVRAQ